MNEWFNNLVTQLNGLPPGRRLTLLLTAAGSLAFFAWLVVGAGRTEYRALYRGLPEDEIARIADGLRGEQIDYQLADGGTTILVPAAEVFEARIRMAGQGLPQGSSSGFELFDKPGFGVTDFVHRVNYVRAIQGELARSVEQLEPVERARVQVVVPERKSVIAARERKPTAAVVVKMRPGRTLEDEQVRAIVHLVASSIESLQPGSVTVVDDSGRLLAPQGDAAAGSRRPGGAPGYQARVEADLAQRIETLLAKTVGPGGVVARVRADMNWTESETTEERFDPDSQVARSEHRTTESSADGSGGDGGVPGVAANTPGGAGGGATGGGTSSNAARSSETLNFEISKTVSRSVTPMGEIERLSIAVLLADPVASEEGAEPPPPWDEESILRFEELAKGAVGFSTRRGDRITITSAPFRSPVESFEEPGVLGPELLLLISNLVRALAVLLGLFAFSKFVLKPLLGTVRSDGMTGGLPARVSDLEARLTEGAELADAETPQLGAASGARRDDSMQVLRNWLSQV